MDEQLTQHEQLTLNEQQTLRRVFGVPRFRPGQRAVVRALRRAHNDHLMQTKARRQYLASR